MPITDENLTEYLEDKFWDIRNYIHSHNASIKEQYKKEYENQIQSLKRENHELRENIKTKTEYLSGKDMELEALRRQLNCFINKKPLCSTCTQRIGNEDLTKEDSCRLNWPLTQQENSKLSQKESQRLVAAAKRRKRMKLDSSSSSVSRNAAGPLHGEKRRRIDHNGSGLQHKFRPKSDSKKPDSHWLSKKSDQPIRKGEPTATNKLDSTKRDVTKKECDSTLDDISEMHTDTVGTLTLRTDLEVGPHLSPDQSLALHVNNVSPPSVQYDASLAIRNAVNSKDLANLEESYYGNLSDSSLSSVAVAGKTAQAYRQKKLVTKTCAAMPPSHGLPVYKAADVGVKNRLKQSKLNIHGAGFRNKNLSEKLDLASLKKGSTNSTKNKNFQDLDETTLEMSQKSSNDDLTIGCSPSAVQNKAKTVLSTKTTNQHKDGNSKSKKLPQVGGSPSETEFKRPALPSKNANSSDQNKVTSSYKNMNEDDENLHQNLDIETSDPLACSTLKMKESIDISGNSPPTQFLSSTMASETLLPDCATLGCSPESKLSTFASAVFPAGVLLTDNFIKEGNHKNIENSKPAVSKSNERKESPHQTHKYNTVVRKKEERMKLPGHFCYECQAYYKNSGLTDEQIEAKMKNCSRHRAQFRIPQTPDGFWNLSISSPGSQDKENVAYKNKATESPSNIVQSKESKDQALAAKGSRRRRPLKFPPGELNDDNPNL